MPRKPSVWFRRSHSMFFTQVNRKKVPLTPGPDTPENRRLAEDALARLLVSDTRHLGSGGVCPPAPAPTISVTPTNNPGQTVSAAVADFLALTERRCQSGRIGPSTLVYTRAALSALSAEFGGRPVASLTADALEEWAGRPAWSPSTRRLYLDVVRRCLRAAGHPVSVRRPPMESRGADVVLTADQFARVLADLRRLGPRRSGDAAELLTVLRATGARPGELAGLAVEDVDWDGACVRKTKHKTRRKTGKDRIIHLNTEAMAVLLAQRNRYGTGPLFRNCRGLPYSAASLRWRLGNVSERLGFRVIAYGAGRHSFATAALIAGVPDAVVAALLGQKGTATLHHHYSHVAENSKVLKEAAERVSRAG